MKNINNRFPDVTHYWNWTAGPRHWLVVCGGLAAVENSTTARPMSSMEVGASFASDDDDDDDDGPDSALSCCSYR